jgi:hypothetical protein
VFEERCHNRAIVIQLLGHAWQRHHQRERGGDNRDAARDGGVDVLVDGREQRELPDDLVGRDGDR